MINNRYGAVGRFFMSYEIGVMIGIIDKHPTNIDFVDSVERLCKNITLNNIMVADGIIDYAKENSYEYNEDEINELLIQYGLNKLEYNW